MKNKTIVVGNGNTVTVPTNTTGTAQTISVNSSGTYSVTGNMYSTINPLFPYWLNPYKLYEFIGINILAYEPDQYVFHLGPNNKHRILDYEP